jgi:hypothetical protein
VALEGISGFEISNLEFQISNSARKKNRRQEEGGKSRRRFTNRRGQADRALKIDLSIPT